jgi:hypothetical protein|tara:strand:- start:195 stop:368 length:174 start_codon:yes stop_codon:yes gene_type:complete
MKKNFHEKSSKSYIGMSYMSDFFFAFVVGMFLVVMFIIGFWVGVRWQTRMKIEKNRV